jgi:hypothetical protein
MGTGSNEIPIERCAVLPVVNGTRLILNMQVVRLNARSLDFVGLTPHFARDDRFSELRSG